MKLHCQTFSFNTSFVHMHLFRRLHRPNIGTLVLTCIFINSSQCLAVQTTVQLAISDLSADYSYFSAICVFFSKNSFGVEIIDFYISLYLSVEFYIILKCMTAKKYLY